MRIYVDCSDTQASRLNTGIQRVVRNIVNRLAEIEETNFTPVYLESGTWRNVSWKLAEALPAKRSILSCFFGYLKGVLVALFWVLLALLPSRKLRHNIDGWLKLQLRYLRRKPQSAVPEVRFERGDALVLLDATWNRPESWLEILDLQTRGIRVISVVYDLIPVDFPRNFTEPLVRKFLIWARKVVYYSDGVVAISKTTAQKVVDFSAAAGGRIRRCGYFYLGTDLGGGVPGTGIVRSMLRDFLGSGGDPVFLVVGTIEPRKNHRLILEAFRMHLVANPGARLLILGRHGWLADDFAEALEELPSSSRLWIQDASDCELEFAYQRSRALIFASAAEGFGLPLVEARQRGLPVIASDIPVFRETSDEGVVFFPPGDAKSLSEVLARDFSRRDAMKWFSWSEATRQFGDAILKQLSDMDRPNVDS